MGLRQLDQTVPGPLQSDWVEWRNRFLTELTRLLGACTVVACEKSRAISDGVCQRIDPSLPGEQREETLSRKAIWILASTPGVTTVLVGMRREDYVDDAIGVLQWPVLPDVDATFTALKHFQAG